MTISTEQYTEGLCGDGAAILFDGMPMSIGEILADLQSGATAKAELLAVREAAPYGYLREHNGQVQISIGPIRPADRASGYATPWGAVYAAPPAPAVTDEISADQAYQLLMEKGGVMSPVDAVVFAWNACRAAMLVNDVTDGKPVTGNSPVIPDGWKLVPIVELTEKMVIHGFESEAFEALADAVQDEKGWPYSCRESAECVTGIFKAMVEVAPSPGGSDDSHATAT